jgi:hypothetical protein
MSQLKSENLKSTSITTLALFLIFQPIPFGLRGLELFISLIIGFVILIINKDIIVKKKIFLFFTFLISLFGTTYSITFYKESFDVYNFFRSLIPLYIFLVFMFADIKISFFKKIDKYLLFLILCAIINILLYFFGLDLYNASTDLAKEVKRFYISFHDLIFFTLIIFLANSSIGSLLSFFILAVTFSKEIFLKFIFIILPFFFYIKIKLIGKIYLFIFFFFPLIFFFNSTLKERFNTLILMGDNFRLFEFEQVVSRMTTDPLRFLIGNGPGIQYKEKVSDNALESLSSLNSYYDVHNFFLKLCLTFGFPLTFILIILFYKILSLKSFLLRTLIIIHIITVNNVSLFSAIGIRYLIYKFLKYKKNFSHK